MIDLQFSYLAYLKLRVISADTSLRFRIKKGFMFFVIFSILFQSSPDIGYVFAQTASDSASTIIATDSAEFKAINSSDPTSVILKSSSITVNDGAKNVNLPTQNILPTQGPSAGLSKKQVRVLDRKNLGGKEKIKVFLTDTKLDEVKIRLKNSNGENTAFIIQQEQVGDSTVLSIAPAYQFRPGKYELEITDSQDQQTIQDFTWGVLAINPNKYLYKVGEKAKMAIAVLNENGAMDCSASVELKITDPKGDKTSLSTSDRSIKVNPECYLKQKVDKPDYETEYEIKDEGNYVLELSAKTQNGDFSITDNFQAKIEPDFNIERLSATRIFPTEPYEMKINVSAKEDFDGYITENVPLSFSLSQLENASFDYTSISSISSLVSQ